ncbi:hypothetical protein ACFRMQ_06205 [Kitasatospora sp. NPDC056783]|uniref:hypothetical protein n=1 Tax=Kitasatospora sp. NPDC056783 TaxID=3345943 RepID=UPI0036A0ACC4
MAAQIADSKTIEVRLTQAENLVIAHHTATVVTEYWDIVYAPCLTDEEIAELVDLEEQIFMRYGIRPEHMVVTREENDYPHPWFPGSKSHTYSRLCPKVAL